MDLVVILAFCSFTMVIALCSLKHSMVYEYGNHSVAWNTASLSLTES